MISTWVADDDDELRYPTAYTKLSMYGLMTSRTLYLGEVGLFVD